MILFSAFLKAQFVLLPLFLFYRLVFPSRDLVFLQRFHKTLLLSLPLLALLITASGRFSPLTGESQPADLRPIVSAQTTTHAAEEGALQEPRATPLVRPAVFRNLGTALLRLCLFFSAAGFCFFLGCALSQFRRERKILRNAVLRERAGRVLICYSPEVTQAFTSGIFRNKIFLPLSLRQNPLLCRIIRQHELMHCRRGDLWWSLFEIMIARIFWYNPLLSWLNRQGYLLREMSCDHQTSQYYGRRTYVETLLYSAGATEALPLLSAGWRQKKSSLLRRIEVLLAGPNTGIRWQLFLLLPAILAGGLLFSGASSFEPSANPIKEHPGTLSRDLATDERLMPKNEEKPAFTWPVEEDSGRITLDFGIHDHPFTQEPFFHQGWDIAWRTGTRILASAGGRVKEISVTEEKQGTTILLDHGLGYETFYAHLDSVHCEENQAVAAGDWIGSMGNSGVSTGPHLHFEIRLKEEAQNPGEFLTARASPAE